jgi:hypothetical protein
VVTVNATSLYVELPTPEMRWEIRRAALDSRSTIRELVTGILSAWLTEHGYGADSDEAEKGEMEKV